ncbi:MAG: hypothetical protein B6244_04280 [Candidatus Cloacimonetes bacterium 4572_55]|nr:MAG: hypothetical protein B6244_04280 [Candidatus Cloacimonetes bacterium 4572_55]
MIRKKQCTIGGTVSYSGIGLHTGNKTTITFKPAPPDTGVRFVRVDLPNSPAILADIDHVVDISRGTSIGQNGFKIHTVEHVLAAIAGLGIDNLYAELDGNEPPAADGSSRPFLEALKSTKIVKQEPDKKYFVVDSPISFSDNDKELFIIPYNGFKVSYTIDYPHPLVGTSFLSLEITPESFSDQISAARTFAFIDEVELLKEQGLIKGGSLETAIVIGDDAILNEEPLRFENEFVRHKILDLVGDLFLVGQPIVGHVYASKSGHGTHVELARLLRKLAKKRDQKKQASEKIMNTERIQSILPHRYPFLLIDRVLEIETNKRIVAIKNVTINEPFFLGHFPDKPIMPGVLQLEAMAQAGGLLLLNQVENPEKKLVYFTGIDRVKFRKPVVPGDQIRLVLETIRARSKFSKMIGRGYVDEKIVVEAELSAALVDR